MELNYHQQLDLFQMIQPEFFLFHHLEVEVEEQRSSLHLLLQEDLLHPQVQEVLVGQEALALVESMVEHQEVLELAEVLHGPNLVEEHLKEGEGEEVAYKHYQ